MHDVIDKLVLLGSLTQGEGDAWKKDKASQVRCDIRLFSSVSFFLALYNYIFLSK